MYSFCRSSRPGLGRSRSAGRAGDGGFALCPGSPRARMLAHRTQSNQQGLPQTTRPSASVGATGAASHWSPAQLVTEADLLPGSHTAGNTLAGSSCGEFQRRPSDLPCLPARLRQLERTFKALQSVLLLSSEPSSRAQAAYCRVAHAAIACHAWQLTIDEADKRAAMAARLAALQHKLASGDVAVGSHSIKISPQICAKVRQLSHHAGRVTKKALKLPLNTEVFSAFGDEATSAAMTSQASRARRGLRQAQHSFERAVSLLAYHLHAAIDRCCSSSSTQPYRDALSQAPAELQLLLLEALASLQVTDGRGAALSDKLPSGDMLLAFDSCQAAVQHVISRQLPGEFSESYWSDAVTFTVARLGFTRQQLAAAITPALVLQQLSDGCVGRCLAAAAGQLGVALPGTVRSPAAQLSSLELLQRKLLWRALGSQAVGLTVLQLLLRLRRHGSGRRVTTGPAAGSGKAGSDAEAPAEATSCDGGSNGSCGMTTAVGADEEGSAQAGALTAIALSRRQQQEAVLLVGQGCEQTSSSSRRPWCQRAAAAVAAKLLLRKLEM